MLTGRAGRERRGTSPRRTTAAQLSPGEKDFNFEVQKERYPYQMNSLQIEQNVGCLKNVAINLCPLT